MSPWRRHPSLRRLSAFADDACGPDEARALREHLGECERCRHELAFMLDLGAMGREISAPRPPADLKREILSRWEAGERRILPLHDPPPVERRPHMAGFLGLAAALLLAVGVVAFLVVGEAAAGASELRLAPGTLPAGASLGVEYRTPSELAAEERLRLRVRYRAAGDPAAGERLGRSREAALARVRPGRFRGSVWMPEGAVYALFSVEDAAGWRVDANGGRMWEVLARDATGRPTFEALLQRTRALEGVRWSEALASARLATELYPERIEGWAYRALYDGFLLEGDRRDSLVADHRRRFAAFERELARADEVDAERVAALTDYARTLGDEEAIARWTARLAEVSPRHRLVVQARLLEILGREGADPASQLRALDEEWERSGPADESLLHAGFRAALRSGQPGPILEWGDRIDRYARGTSFWVATELAGVPELRREGIARLRQALALLEGAPPEERRLDRSVEEHRAANRSRTARLLTSLGRALAAEGEMEAARSALARAAETAWDPELFLDLAELHLAWSDTAAAVELLGLAAADPLSPPPEAAPPGHPALSGLSEREWEARMAEGRAELRRRVLARADRRPLPDAVQVVDIAGRDRELAELLEEGPALLVFWSHQSHPALRALPRLRAAVPLLAAAGARLVLVSEGEPTMDAEERLLRAGLEAPSFFDADGHVARALELWGTPFYLVADGDGLIHARHLELEEGLRAALLLARELSPAD